MEQKKYISVILPLKLDWEASYFVPEGMGEVKVGDRVRVIFANRKYLGVVCATDITPDVDTRRVQSILAIERGLRSIGIEEIRLWQRIAEQFPRLLHMEQLNILSTLVALFLVRKVPSLHEALILN